MREIRGNQIAMIFQEPMTSLNPVFTVGEQIGEAVRLHQGWIARRRARGAVEMLRPGRHPRARAARRRLSAPAVRRHAPARDDRDGARVRAGAADRRRADHRAGRHDPGADPGAARRAAGASAGWRCMLITHDLGVVAETCDEVVGDVRGPGRRAGAGARSCSRSRGTRTPRACCARSRAGRAARRPASTAAAHHPRHGARRCSELPAGLPVPRSLRARDRGLRRGSSRRSS